MISHISDAHRALLAESAREYDQERRTAEATGRARGKANALIEDNEPRAADSVEKNTQKEHDESASDAAEIHELEAMTAGLVDEPNILEKFGESVEASGLVGETVNAKILFLVTTTRPFERPASSAIKGASSVGKSHLVKCVLKHLPSEAYIERTGLSEKALAYSEEDFRHRHIIIYEAAGLNSEFGSYLIRSLLSEGKLIYEFVEKTKQGMRPRIIEKEGPTGLITTTTSPKLHPENETRLLSLSIKDDRQQTEAIMAALAREACGDQSGALDYAKWHALQRWIIAGECRVVVPFAAALAELIPPVAVRLRRDFTMLLTLIKAHALLHRKQRTRDQDDRVVASLEDYAAVRGLLLHLFAEGVEATVSDTVRKTVEAVEQLGGLEVSAAAVGRLLELDRNTVHHRIRKALERGFLVNSETRKGHPSKLSKGEPIPDGTEILPSIKDLRNRWSVGAASGGDTREQANGPKQAAPNGSLVSSPLDAPTVP
jgi:biotin operon repressor